MVGGRFFPGVGRAQGVFERLRTELTEAYELGIEAEPGDLDGKPHEVRVTTTRKAIVRARRFVATAAPPADWTARLAHLVAQPVDVVDLPIAMAAHSFRGEEAATLKVIIRAEIGHSVTTTAPVRYAAVVMGARDAVVMNVTGTTASDGGVLLSTQLPPGRYRVRLAALDGSGRAGTLETPIVAEVRASGGFQLSDVIVGTASEGPSTGYRDVLEVNGEPVHDRRDRIVIILADSAPARGSRAPHRGKRPFQRRPRQPQFQSPDDGALFLPRLEPVPLHVHAQGDEEGRWRRHAGDRVP